ncbi:probable G-protein coupled receptor CG31760 [Schistocerca americana]|uniref:probable G-protein coupled receptor CG31760 n=1 Tax=Schistocerca americana TaxID=7009 RepID=UPI001F4FAA81|nr:probable G-protein coupled receptor CG31760 [Schistocerca americana]
MPSTLLYPCPFLCAPRPASTRGAAVCVAGFNTYTFNETAHTPREPDEILSVTYEDGKWSKPYYDCGGGNIWMLTYTVPFFGYNGSYFFKGTSGIDIDLRRVDIDQCPLPPGSTQLNIFAASDKCKERTTQCVPLPGLGFRRGSYKCVCRKGFYFPDVHARYRYFNGSIIEEEYEKLMMGRQNLYSAEGSFECLACAEGCDSCVDDRPCVVSLNWVMRTAILVLSCVVICCLPVVVLFTWKYGNVKVVRAASPVLLRVIALGAFFIYCTTIVMYPTPNVVTCTMRVWLREIGFSLTYGALMLKTWRISVIFRVRSAKAIKITDFDLLKRLGVIVAVFSVFLVIRTLVAPPHVIVGRTADDLKAYLCRTDWWDHSFTTMEVMFLVWGIRLCIVVRKAPSEFNESRFISMAIYNEFLLSVFLNVSMLFLQSPANPDLLYIIFFCHTQLTVTLLLGLIFGSKAYLVLKGHGKLEQEGSSAAPRPQAAKFLSKARSANSQCLPSTNSSAAELTGRLSDVDVQEEFQRVYAQLELLKEKNMRLGNRHLAARISAMQEAARSPGLPEEAVPAASAASPPPQLNSALAAVAERLVGTSVPAAAVASPLPAAASANTSSSEAAAASAPELELSTPLDPLSSSAAAAVVAAAAVGAPSSTVVHRRGSRRSAVDADGAASTSPDQRRNRNLKSGHARTHAIVINLDDKNRFTEEVTV